MNIHFDELVKSEIEHFKDGKGSISNQTKSDENVRIMRNAIHKNSSIGMHKHETNFEVVSVVSGKGIAVSKDGEEILEAGVVHYCPCSGAHELINTGDEDLVLLCIVADAKQ